MRRGGRYLDLSNCILLAVLALCAVHDIRHHRIPNWIVGWGIALGLAFGCGVFSGFGPGEAMAGGGKMGWLADSIAGGGGCIRVWAGFLGRMFLVWGIGFPFFVFGMTGAGDIKVMGLIAAFMGMKDGMTAVWAGLCLGAVLALGKMLHQGSIYQRFLYLSAYIRRLFQDGKIEKYYCRQRDGIGCVIPLGACFFAGTLFTVLWKG